MEATSRLLVTYLLNAVWQVPAVLAVAFICARLMGRLPARYAHRLWVVALLLSTLLPFVSLGRISGKRVSALASAEQVQDKVPNASGGSTNIFWWLGGESRRQPVTLAPFLTWTLVAAYLTFCGYLLARLAWAWRCTNRLRAASSRRPLPDHLAKIAEKLSMAFGGRLVPILYSAEITGPITVGFRHPVLILPEIFFTEISEADFSSAVCHELAHVCRHDFAWNLAYELFSLPVSLHPATAAIKARIEQTRELVCDEMASARLDNRGAYARSLLNIAKFMYAQPPASPSYYSLGLFDTNTLEERIMNLLKKTTPASQRFKTLAMLAAATLLALTALALSAFSLQVAQAAGNTDLKPFAGTWTAQFKGKPFMVLTMKEEGGKLTGNCLHTVDMAENDQGELTRVADKQVTDTVVDAQVTGSTAIVSIGDGNPNHVARFDFRVTGPDTAEMRPVHHSENKVITQWWKLARS